MSDPHVTRAKWKASARKIPITPREPIRLAGFADRVAPSDGVLQEIHARALALQDECGVISVLLSADLLGFTRAMAGTIADRVLCEFGLPRERLVLNSSHNHSGPVTDDLLHTFFDLDEAEKAVIARYTDWLLDELVKLIGAAMQELQPVEISCGQSVAGFGVNRRRARPGYRHWPGPVDHDVPVLRVSTPSGGLLAVVFGYACHTTASHGNEIHGDYAGYAQTQLEKAHPGAVALFVAGCGGDINPLPRSRPEAAEIYGGVLATAVEEVLAAVTKPIQGPIRAVRSETELPLEPTPTREELTNQLQYAEGHHRRALNSALAILDHAGALPQSCTFSAQVWKFGDDLNWIWLCGEPVVDYALRFKNAYGWDSTWVCGYCDELVAYVPSRRVLAEGGYEGRDAMTEYGWFAPFTPDVEELVAGVVECLMQSNATETKNGTRRDQR